MSFIWLIFIFFFLFIIFIFNFLCLWTYIFYIIFFLFLTMLYTLILYSLWRHRVRMANKIQISKDLWIIWKKIIFNLILIILYIYLFHQRSRQSMWRPNYFLFWRQKLSIIINFFYLFFCNFLFLFENFFFIKIWLPLFKYIITILYHQH